MNSSRGKHLEDRNKLADFTKKVPQISEKGNDVLLGRMYLQVMMTIR